MFCTLAGLSLVMLTAAVAAEPPEPNTAQARILAPFHPGLAALPPPAREMLLVWGELELLLADREPVSGMALQLLLAPPTDPWGEPWQVALEHSTVTSISPTQLEKTRVDPSGGWASSPRPPGTYQVRILDHLDNVWHAHSYELSALLGPVSIDLEALAVEGKVELDSEAWQGTLLFGGQDAVSIAAATDQRGRYSVVLPRQGRWPITAEFSDGSYLDLDDVEIFSPVKGPAILDLTLPDFKIEGEVYLEEEKLAKATVLMRDPARPGIRLAGTLSDEDGHFVLRGRRVMDVVVTALHQDSKAVWLPGRLAADSPPLRLELVPFRKVRGRILSSAGQPVGEARVELRSGASSVLPFTDRGATSADGAFELRMAPDSGPAEILVLAPGFAMVWRELSNAGAAGRVLEIRLSPQIGALELQRVSRDLLASVRLNGPERAAPLKRWIEAVLPFGLFSTTPDGALRLAGLGAGEYSLCLAERCKTGILAGGEELALSVAELAP